ncbi:MAG: polA [Parachlamydiales bacterium]|nr:polA [Parachlamydiales bacterium]
MDKIFIIDAVNYLFRSYYAIGPMTNDQGESTNALFGFIRSVQKLIKDFSPAFLIAIFDGPDNKKTRQAVYAEYKMHRKGAPEDLFAQFDRTYEFCKLSGIPVLCIEGVEADDTMASVAVWARKMGSDVYLCSSDKDLMQLVDDHTFMIQSHKDNLRIDAAQVVERYGVRPDQMLDLLAIMGDASDNIPGLEGFGPKTAASLLQEFGTLDFILAHPEKVKGEKKQEILRTQRETALLSRQLATLDTQIDIPHVEEFYRIKPTDREGLADFYHRMKFNTLLRDMGPMATPAPEEKKSGKRYTEIHDYVLVDSPHEIDALLAKLMKEPQICIDTETTDKKPFNAELVGIGFGTEPGHAYYIPMNGQAGEATVLPALREFFSRCPGQFFGHNLKYDWHILQNYHIDLKKISFDTILASYLLSPHQRRHNLDELALEKFKKIKIPIVNLIGKGKQIRSMRDVPVEEVKNYCCEDVDYTTRLKELFEEELQNTRLDRLLHDVELPLLTILGKMERTGIFLDRAKLQDCGQELEKEIIQLKIRIFQNIGEEFNLNSPQQLSRMLFEKMAMRLPGKKQASTSTAADVLEELAIEYPVAGLILEYRTLEKLRSTYVDALPDEINAKTGRIHCTFNQSTAATGRLSCQDPNLQNIPVRGVQGRRIRECFMPQKSGWSYVGADYSQIELRLLAHFSEDPQLIKAFQNGEDIHAYTASLICGVPLDQVTPEMRSQAKAVNFGILYGQGPYGLSRQTGLSFGQASAFIKTYFERYPLVAEYIQSMKDLARKTGMAKTLTGRQRPIPDIDNKNPAVRAAAERLAVNTPLQGTAADLIKLAMIHIDRSIDDMHLEGAMILQIHDELIFEVPDHEIPAFESMVKEKMENVIQLNIPIEVTVSVGKNWGEC